MASANALAVDEERARCGVTKWWGMSIDHLVRREVPACPVYRMADEDSGDIEVPRP